MLSYHAKAHGIAMYLLHIAFKPVGLTKFSPAQKRCMKQFLQNTKLQCVRQSLAVGPACGGEGERGCLFDAELPLLLARMKAETAALAAGD